MLPRMRAFPVVPVALMAVVATLAPPAARATAASVLSIAESVGALVGSVSNSIRKSSESSAPRPLAEGDYRVIRVAAAEGRPGQVQLTMRPTGAADDAATDDDWMLLLPQAVAELRGLGVGQVVSARARPYGLELAHAGRAFFLVLHDDWYRELDARPVQL